MGPYTLLAEDRGPDECTRDGTSRRPTPRALPPHLSSYMLFLLFRQSRERKNPEGVATVPRLYSLGMSDRRTLFTLSEPKLQSRNLRTPTPTPLPRSYHHFSRYLVLRSPKGHKTLPFLLGDRRGEGCLERVCRRVGVETLPSYRMFSCPCRSSGQSMVPPLTPSDVSSPMGAIHYPLGCFNHLSVVPTISFPKVGKERDWEVLMTRITTISKNMSRSFLSMTIRSIFQPLSPSVDLSGFYQERLLYNGPCQDFLGAFVKRQFYGHGPLREGYGPEV